MSRINASEARGLLEAYNAVYAPQELTEEQIWEEVENWVNSLLEEGYDLSEYTWEEMYEAYIQEISIRDITAQARQNLNLAANTAKDIVGAGLQGYKGQKTTSSNPIARTYNAATRSVRDAAAGFITGKGSTPEAKPQPSTDYQSRFARKKNAAPGIGDIRGGKGNVSTTRTSATTRPAAPTSAAKVSPTRAAVPATGTLGKTSYQVRTPTSAELKAAQAARAGGANPEQALRAAKAAGTASKIQSAGQMAGAKAFSSPTSGASAFKPATIAAASSTSPSASGSVAPATAAIASTPKPTPVAPRQTARERVLNQSYEYDAYDLVLEYLLNNGHVETVDEAHYVMLEMEAEVIRDIVGEVVEQMSGGPTDSPIDKGGAKWNKGQKLSDPRAQKVYDKLTGTKLPPA